jgi:aspartate/methionine/tyrosine aminotransferase
MSRRSELGAQTAPLQSPPSLRFASRTENIAAFQVMELVKRANALQAQGKPVIHMSIGEPDFTAPAPVLNALAQAAASGMTQYTAALGIAPLREAIARFYGQRFNADISPSRIIVTAGASAALSLAACALVNPGDRVLLTDPSYPCNRHFVAAFDGIPEAVPVGPETRFQMTEELIRQHWMKNGKAAVGTLLATPANPTGTSIKFDELRRIVETVSDLEGFSIVDEIYLGLSYDTPPRSILEVANNVVVTNSFSKFFHMTGWRLGWLVVPEEAVNVFERLTQNLYICASALAQHAALACFTDESLKIFDDRAAQFKARRDYLAPELLKLGFKIPAQPDGAFYFYLDCSALSDSSTRLANELLETAYVSLVPGTDFGASDPERYMRLSYATDMPRLQEAVARMATFFKRSA